MDALVSLLLGSVVAATPTVPTPWFAMDDYPLRAWELREEGPTAFELIVAPNGKPVRCTVTRSSGFDLLDRKACSVAMRKARFKPALGTDGQPTYGTYRSLVNWAIDPYKWAQMEVGPDLEVEVSKLPGAATKPVDVKFAYLVDAQGRTSGCSAIASNLSRELEPLGCEQISKALPRPQLAVDGAVPVVRTSWIRFTPEN